MTLDIERETLDLGATRCLAAAPFVEGILVSRLTEQEWRRLEPLLQNIKPDRQEAARRRLVEGLTLSAAGEPFGYSKSDVSYIVKLVLRWWEKLGNLPEKPKPPAGWTVVELMVPRRRVDEVRRLVEALYPRPGPDRTDDARRATGPGVAAKRRRKPSLVALKR
jgi:hypothetical protein